MATAICAFMLHHGMAVSLAPEAFDVEHENFELGEHIGRQKIAVNFNRDGWVFPFPGPGGIKSFDHAADQAGERRNVDNARIAVHHGRGGDTAGNADF